MTDLLAGHRVVGFGEHLPLLYGLMVLRDLGAEVVLVEPPGGIASRHVPEIFEPLAGSFRSLCVDLKDPDGQQAVRGLVARGDVLVEAYRPGKLAVLGLGEAALRELAPDLVYVSLSGYGQTGPYRDVPGHELSYQGVAGVLAPAPPAVAPTAEPRSWSTPAPVGDFVSGTFAALAAVAGLLRRHGRGGGTTADVSMTDCLTGLVFPQVLAALRGGPAPVLPPDDPGHGVFATADDLELSVSIAHEDHFWASLCATLGLDDLAGLSTPARLARSGELRAAVAERIRRRSRAEWLIALDRAGVPAGPVHDVAQVAEDPQVRARHVIRRSPDGSGPAHVGQPIVFDGASPAPRGAVPGLGEHTAALLAEAGLPEAEVDRLLAAGVAVGPVARRDPVEAPS